MKKYHHYLLGIGIFLGVTGFILALVSLGLENYIYFQQQKEHLETSEDLENLKDFGDNKYVYERVVLSTVAEILIFLAFGFTNASVIYNFQINNQW